eukprot:gene6356-8590_t
MRRPSRPSCVRRFGFRCPSCRTCTRLAECEKAADELATLGLSTTVADARFMKPLDEDMILKLARDHEVLLTIEEGSIGGFGCPQRRGWQVREQRRQA